MKVSQGFLSSILLLVSAAAVPLTGCYTQLASDKGDAWGYTGHSRHVVIQQTEPVSSDTTVIYQQPTTAANMATPDANASAMNDTVYVDDARPRTDYSYPTQTVINNYYDNAIPNDYYWYPRRSGFSISFGYNYPLWPEYSYYSPWYSQSWYDPYDAFYHGYYRGPGRIMFEPYYPYPASPFYNCYAPVYSPDPYWYRGLGGGYYGGYYGGYGNDHRGYGDHDGRNGGGPRTGRINGGERRGGTTTGRAPASSSGTIQQGGTPNVMSIDDRNAPVHSVAPGVVASTGNRSTVPASQNASTGTVTRADNMTSTNSTNDAVRLSTPTSNRTVARMNAEPSTGNATNVAPRSATTTATRSAATTGRHVVVIHRSAPEPSTQSAETGRAIERSSESSGVARTSNESSRRASTQSSSEPQYVPRETRTETQPAPESSGSVERSSESPRGGGESRSSGDGESRSSGGGRSDNAGTRGGGRR